jgi:hypothetical protein
MADTKQSHQPIQRSVHVDCPVEDAFRFFTEHFSEWWPLATHSLTPEEAETCEIEPWVGGRLFERTRSGEEREWGTVTAWEPETRIAFAWHPGNPNRQGQTVEIAFRTDAIGTEVILTHYGWEASGVQAFAGAQVADPVSVIAASFARFVRDQMLVMA